MNDRLKTGRWRLHRRHRRQTLVLEMPLRPMHRSRDEETEGTPEARQESGFGSRSKSGSRSPAKFLWDARKKSSVRVARSYNGNESLVSGLSIVGLAAHLAPYYLSDLLILQLSLAFQLSHIIVKFYRGPQNSESKNSEMDQLERYRLVKVRFGWVRLG